MRRLKLISEMYGSVSVPVDQIIDISYTKGESQYFIDVSTVYSTNTLKFDTSNQSKEEDKRIIKWLDWLDDI